MPLSWDDLAAATLGRQFPRPAGGVEELLAQVGPVQSQTARSPFVALAARFPGTTREAVVEAYGRDRARQHHPRHRPHRDH